MTTTDLTATEKFKARIRGVEFLPLTKPLRLTASRLLTLNPWDSVPTFSGRELVFIHVPKTAGTSITEALDIPNGHIPIARYYAWDPNRFEAAIKVAFVRNPWTRLFSAYNYLKASIGVNNSPDVRWATANLSEIRDFEHFVERLGDRRYCDTILRYTHFRPQVDWINVPETAGWDLDYTFRFEKLSEEIDQLSEILHTDLEIPHRRKPLKRLEPLAWRQAMIDKVADIYADDIQAFSYSAPNITSP